MSSPFWATGESRPHRGTGSQDPHLGRPAEARTCARAGDRLQTAPPWGAVAPATRPGAAWTDRGLTKGRTPAAGGAARHSRSPPPSRGGGSPTRVLASLRDARSGSALPGTLTSLQDTRRGSQFLARKPRPKGAREAAGDPAARPFPPRASAQARCPRRLHMRLPQDAEGAPRPRPALPARTRGAQRRLGKGGSPRARTP